MYVKYEVYTRENCTAKSTKKRVKNPPSVLTSHEMVI
jgi:hypothetical protein